jgi:hypothetical protein
LELALFGDKDLKTLDFALEAISNGPDGFEALPLVLKVNSLRVG